VIAKVASFDSEAQQIVRDWQAVIQFGYLGGPLVQLQFADGNCRVYRQAAAKADVAFWFPTPGLLNNMMTGQGFTLPLIKGFWNVKLLKGFMALAKRLEYYLKEQDGKELDAEMTTKVLTCKLAVATWGTAVLAGSEPKLAPLANHIPAGGTVNFRIKPAGPNFYFKKSEAGAFLGFILFLDQKILAYIRAVAREFKLFSDIPQLYFGHGNGVYDVHRERFADKPPDDFGVQIFFLRDLGKIAPLVSCKLKLEEFQGSGIVEFAGKTVFRRIVFKIDILIVRFYRID